MMGSTDDPQADSDVDDGDSPSQSGCGEREVSVCQCCEEESDEHVDVDYDGVFEALGLPVAEIAHGYDIVLIIARRLYSNHFLCL